MLPALDAMSRFSDCRDPTFGDLVRGSKRIDASPYSTISRQTSRCQGLSSLSLLTGVRVMKKKGGQSSCVTRQKRKQGSKQHTKPHSRPPKDTSETVKPCEAKATSPRRYKGGQLRKRHGRGLSSPSALPLALGPRLNRFNQGVYETQGFISPNRRIMFSTRH